VETIILMALGSAAVLYWWASLQCKTYAVTFARRECDKQGVQLLDQTVQQIKLSMSRDRNDRWRIWREYRFEYSLDGVNRYEGRLIMLGYRLLRSALETSDPIIH
jgi:hypothetical protein